MVSKTLLYPPGALVSARGRNWVVLPSDEEDVVRLRAIDGSDEDAIGIFLPIEKNSITPSEYDWPEPDNAGNFQGGLLLRDSVRLTLRNGAGPFRSLGSLSVLPRPYQYVPLIMALRQDPVRLLIADDVGVGKTIEAGMIARELLDRGLAKRLGVVCAPHLCEQWEDELSQKFNIETAVIQPSQIGRLERGLPRRDISLYQYYRHLVVSIDYIKSERNKRPFLDNCPDLIIVDEAHTAARPRGDRGSNQHQRFEFLKELSAQRDRHLILVTATPHSGVEESFRSVLGLLDDSFDVSEDKQLPRRRITPHFIQRKRSDLKNWMDNETPFPDRESIERSYRLSPDYLKLFQDVVIYCRESVHEGQDGKRQRQRVRYWAAIAILRCVLSSPAAAEAMLEKRAEKQKSEADPDFVETEEALANQILDSSDDDMAPDYVPSAALDEENISLTESELRKLSGFLRTARSLSGPKQDMKLADTAEAVNEFLRDGYSPIVFCRFIATAEYVAEQLQSMLGKTHPGIRVLSVTGGDGNNEQRKAKVEELGKEPVRVLVATDCLSEGVNLQENFNAVLHYDLPWNPNRLEQREGRVDRFGQEKDTVRAVLLFGADNPMDLVVLNVLIRKARTIRSRLGISVPVPVESDQVVQALIDSVLFSDGGQQLRLEMGDPEVTNFHSQWDSAAEHEDQTRAFFAQHQIDPNEVATELQEMEPVLGSTEELKDFVANAIQRFGGSLNPTGKKDVFNLEAGELNIRMADRIPDMKFPLRVSFDGVPREGIIRLGRNHPAVSVISEAVLSGALKGETDNFARCAAIFTDAVQVRTAVLVLRIRYQLQERNAQQFAEEVVVAAFKREGGQLHWIEPVGSYGIDLLKDARSVANMPDREKTENVEWALGMLEDDWYKEIVERRSLVLDKSHSRLRKVVKANKLNVKAHTPPDVLGCYVLIPSGVK